MIKGGIHIVGKRFNTTGICYSDEHYMVDMDKRLLEIEKLVDCGQYFTINRARQYGKTTMIHQLAEHLSGRYSVFSISFEGLSEDVFAGEASFGQRICGLLYNSFVYQETRGISELSQMECEKMSRGDSGDTNLFTISNFISRMCKEAENPVVLIIDEVDQASSQNLFLAFLGMLRDKYLKRSVYPTFQSVILAGVYDVRSMKRKIRPDEEHKENSPWNIAARFRVDMGFSAKDIAGMLKEYEADFHTGMKIEEMAEQIYQYTSGYPYLVSWLCKCMDEDIAQNKGDRQRAWTREGLLEAVKMLLQDQNPLFESLIGRLHDFPELGSVISRLLFQGQGIAYNPDDRAVQNAKMFGFVKEEDGSVVIANRIFETRLYNSFLLKLKEQNSHMYEEGFRQKNQFIADGHLNMRLVLEKFAETFHDLYGGCSEAFLEDEGRKYFMLFLRPVINGIGSCYVEPQTRNRERMDLVIDYRGEQSVVELKIWRGNAYHERGEVQLAGYLDSLHLKKGYLLCFCFSKKKERGLKEVLIGDKLIVEAIV